MIGVCCSMHSRLNLFLLCYLCVCLHSGSWCLLPGFAAISSDLNDLGISFDMCRWNLQSSCDPWHWSFCSTCAAHLGSSPGLCSWCWDVLRTSCKLKLSNTVSDIKVGILQIYCKWYYANLQDEKTPSWNRSCQQLSVCTAWLLLLFSWYATFNFIFLDDLENHEIFQTERCLTWISSWWYIEFPTLDSPMFQLWKSFLSWHHQAFLSRQLSILMVFPIEAVVRKKPSSRVTEASSHSFNSACQYMSSEHQ